MKESIIIKLSKEQKQRIKELAKGKISEYVLSKVFAVEPKMFSWGVTIDNGEIVKETSNSNVNNLIADEFERKVQEKVDLLVQDIKSQAKEEVTEGVWTTPSALKYIEAKAESDSNGEVVRPSININQFINSGVMSVESQDDSKVDTIPVTMESKKIQTPVVVVATPNQACVLCGEPNAKPYQRSSGTFWLCHSHKP